MQSLPAASAAQPAGVVAVPEFTVDLTKEQLQPIVLQKLQDIRPRSCSALDLSKLIWPQQTAMRSGMKRTVRFFLVLICYFKKRCLCKVFHSCLVSSKMILFISEFVPGGVAVPFVSALVWPAVMTSVAPNVSKDQKRPGGRKPTRQHTYCAVHSSKQTQNL